MRRMRRNQFALTEQLPPPGMLTHGIKELVVLGLVVNPRDHVPVLVTTDGAYVGIRGLKTTSLFFKHGSGYYDTSGHSRSYEAEQLTNFPRVHTPDGVAPRGSGYGTVLYTALCAGAFLNDAGDAEISMNTDGPGICSEEEGRSSEATKWWTAANRKGLTSIDEIEGEAEREENVDLEVPTDALEPYVDEGSVVYVNSVNVDIEKDGEPLRVDSYKYADAESSNLVVMLFNDPQYADGKQVPKEIRNGTELKWIVETVSNDASVIRDTNQLALLGLDVRGLDVQAVNLIALGYMHAELGDKEVDALYYRWKHNLDPEHEVRQLQMFSPNARAAGLSDVIEARRQADWRRLEDLP